MGVGEGRAGLGPLSLAPGPQVEAWELRGCGAGPKVTDPGSLAVGSGRRGQLVAQMHRFQDGEATSPLSPGSPWTPGGEVASSRGAKAWHPVTVAVTGQVGGGSWFCL